jgi:anti-sigma regulatory factor (Ser/Thr protein kinase)
MTPDLKVDLVLEARLDNLDRLVKAAGSLATQCGFSGTRVMKIELAVEEAVTNVISYAYREGSGQVALTGHWDAAAQNLTIEITDHGSPFNVLELPPPDLTSDLVYRRIGGLGVHFIRTLTDHLYYRREDDRNILGLVFNLAGLTRQKLP